MPQNLFFEFEFNFFLFLTSFIPESVMFEEILPVGTEITHPKILKLWFCP